MQFRGVRDTQLLLLLIIGYRIAVRAVWPIADVFGAGGHGSLTGHFRLPRGSSSWERFDRLNSFTAAFPFYATISGEGAEDG